MLSPDVNRDYPIIVSQSLFEMQGIKAHHVLLYGFLKTLSVKKGYCWISRPALAKRFKTKERNIKYWLAALKDVKAIKVKTVGSSKSQNRRERRIYCLI